jgi:amino acid adenylation domain-containing protein
MSKRQESRSHQAKRQGGDRAVTADEFVEGLRRPGVRMREREQLARALRKGDLPLSFAQERLWFLERLDPGTSAYTIAARRQFLGPLDLTALTNALTELVRRHESLRTTFPNRDFDPVQRIAEAEPVTLPIIDLQLVPQGQRVGAAWRTIHEQVQRPFDLARGPLFRPVLIALGPEEHELLVMVHHIVADGWSFGVLARELTALYEAGRVGLPSPLQELPIQYGDFVLWQRQWLAGELLESQRRYWLKQLAGRPALLELPTDHPRSRRPAVAGANHDFALPRPMVDELRALSQHERATLFMTLLAGFKALLARYSGQENILVGTPVANRNHVDLESVIGLFANTLVLRTDLTGDPTFRELVARVRETCLGAYAHPDMPFEKLVEELQPERTLGQNPLFQVSLVLQDAATSTDLAFFSVDSPFDLTLFVCARRDGTLSATIQYKRSLFEPDTIASLAVHYRTLLEGACADPDRRLSELPLLESVEAQQLLVEWNATTIPYPRDRSVHGLFADRVGVTPDAVALVFEGGSLTYRELDRRANRLAHHLRARGIGPDCRVGVLMERSADMIVGLLGVLKAGGAYVPLDLLAPPERLAFMLADAKIETVLTQARMLARLPARGTRSICVDADSSAIMRQSDTPLEDRVAADDLAYVMYTSGSTGAPKGVAVPHRGVVRLVTADYARFGPDEILLQLAPASFDASTFEIWGALLNGGRLVIAPPDVLSVDELGTVLARHDVTTLWLAAGLFEQVVDASVEILRPLRQLLVGGDVLSPRHVRRVLAALPRLRFVNGYGPTESTTFTCCHAVTSAPPPGLSIPIGRPIANTRIYVLDRHRLPVPIGVPGELWIGGDGLARGYVDRPELTAERFVVHRFSEALEERLYQSGDRVRWLRDGTLEFLGRLDDQLKVRGFRVEPGEIETVLARHPTVRQSVVVARRAPAGGRDLVAYVVGSGSEDSRELREFLRGKLPEYMVPATIVMVGRLPLTPSGKVDRRALPDPAGSGGAAEGAAVEPRDELERQLARIWQEILSVHRVGVRDNFFDLGGHSLLAVRMFARLEEQVRVKLPLATLFQTPTIEGLSAVIRGATWPASGRSLVAIQPAGDRPPVFGMPGVTGTVFFYRDLARYLPPDQPFYGLQSRGIDGAGKALTRVEDIAAEFLREIREIQPEGPYYLVGLCMGGVVAYEMAQQLRATGEEVGLLGLLETWPPLVSSGRRLMASARTRAFLGFVMSRLRLYGQALARLHWREQVRYLLGRIKLLGAIGARGGLSREVRVELYERVVTQANLLAFGQYRPQVYPGPVVLFCAGGRQVAPGHDYRLGWRDLAAGGFDVYTVPGDDSGRMVAEPNVRLVAEYLQSYLDRGQRPATVPGRG